jgi:hypothetical protein
MGLGSALFTSPRVRNKPHFRPASSVTHSVGDDDHRRRSPAHLRHAMVIEGYDTQPTYSSLVCHIQAKVCHDSEPNKINIPKSNHIGEASVKLDIPSLMLTKVGT